MTHTTTTTLLLGLSAILASPLAAASDFTGTVFYEHGNYGGSTLTLLPGEGIEDLSLYWENDWETWNDQISSLAVWGPVTVYLYEHRNYRGEAVAFDLSADRLGDFGWNDRASSIYVDYTEPVGWYWDGSLNTWAFREGDWIYHENGLGWLYAANYDSAWQSGWLYHNVWDWLYTDSQSGGWFHSPTYGNVFHESGSRNPEWWYSPEFGWLSYN